MTKYKLLETDTIEVDGLTLYRIQLTEDHPKWGKAGTIGGYVESMANLSGDAFVLDDARIYGNARVFGDARISGNARVSGNACVYDNACVSGDALIFGNSVLCNGTIVY